MSGFWSAGVNSVVRVPPRCICLHHGSSGISWLSCVVAGLFIMSARSAVRNMARWLELRVRKSMSCASTCFTATEGNPSRPSASPTRSAVNPSASILERTSPRTSLTSGSWYSCSNRSSPMSPAPSCTSALTHGSCRKSTMSVQVPLSTRLTRSLSVAAGSPMRFVQLHGSTIGAPAGVNVVIRNTLPYASSSSFMYPRGPCVSSSLPPSPFSDPTLARVAASTPSRRRLSPLGVVACRTRSCLPPGTVPTTPRGMASVGALSVSGGAASGMTPRSTDAAMQRPASRLL
mmetsp:Transcript_32907/g.71088  ORF Transcript_32907/g.71088 Transcript_32907/m.71088 type:complete len:289 (-) Transcript_32907:92-958(-)